MQNIVTEDVLEGIANRRFLCLKEAANRLGLTYATGRRRILREGLPIWTLRGRRYVRAADLENPALRVP